MKKRLDYLQLQRKQFQRQLNLQEFDYQKEYSNIFECNKTAGLIPQVQIIKRLHDVGRLID